MVKEIFKNKLVVFLIVLYIFSMVTVITWGIPNENHPFNYHMDEWHQMQAIRSLFKYGSSNVQGAANGPVFHFGLSGLYLSPFVAFGIIDPFSIKSAVSALPMQTKLFMILRLNTVLFGALSLLFLSMIAKRYLKTNPSFTLILFIFTPVWLTLSNFFKYDIALTFWITASIYFLLRFGTSPNLKNYLIAGICCSLAFATKITALPILVIYIFAFFYFFPKKRFRYRYLFAGIFIFLIIFLIFGIPDLLLGKGDYGEYIMSNNPFSGRSTGNLLTDYRLSQPWLVYTLFKIWPLNFGYPFFLIYLASFFYWAKQSIVNKFKVNYSLHKNEIFIFMSLSIFILCLLPLKNGANGNRLLVLLPFLTLLSSSFLTIVWKRISGYSRKAFITIFIVIIAVQSYQALAHIYIKWQKDARELSSAWITKNINKGSVIGIENIPIYQLLPDLILKEFYAKQYSPKTHTKFNYELVNATSELLPNFVVITNREFDIDFAKDSPKKQLINRLNRENYKIVVEFKPPEILYKIFGNELDLRTSGIVPIPTITVYKKT